MYRAMTGQPEFGNQTYLALENAGKPDNVTFCLRRGCTKYEDIPGFSTQRVVSVPCAGAFGERKPVVQPVLTGYTVNLRCGTARDCLPADAFVLTEAEAARAVREWIQRSPGRIGNYHPRRPGEPTAYY